MAQSSGGRARSYPDPTQAATVVVLRQYALQGSGSAPIVTIDSLKTYELGVNEHVIIPLPPGDRLVGLLGRSLIGPTIRVTIKIHAEAHRTYYVLMAVDPAPLMTEITEAEGREIMATTKALGGRRRSSSLGF
jgi:hypothetical protein